MLRLVASQYVSSMEIGKVNYEKVLAYISSSVRDLGLTESAEEQESPLKQQLKQYQLLQQQQEEENSMKAQLSRQYQQQQLQQQQQQQQLQQIAQSG